MQTQRHEIYMVNHNGVTLDVVSDKLNAIAFAQAVTSRHPKFPASITTLPRPARFGERASK